jgi:hypothetical protein
MYYDYFFDLIAILKNLEFFKKAEAAGFNVIVVGSLVEHPEKHYFRDYELKRYSELKQRESG